MYQKQLEQLGLSDKEAVVYEALANQGMCQPPELVKPTKLGRTTVYAVLEALVKKDLVEKKQVAGKAHFVVTHPSNLEGLIAIQEKALVNKKETLQSLLPNLVSAYILVSNKPHVRYFEGSEGVQAVLTDSLTAQSEILEYADPEAVMTYIKKENAAYVKQRDKRKIKKKIIVIDSPFARNLFKDYYQKVTDTKYIDHEKFPFYAVMMIYDNKISYLTLTNKARLGIIIEDEQIYKMHRSLFEFTWEKAQTFGTKK
ncbi:MAG: helix-turn-helix domain-containing protein [Patescibacteria group bacterium]